MKTERQLDERISGWLEAEAPRQLPDQVLRATFERTRKTSQRDGWQAVLGRLQMNRLVPALVSGVAIVLVAVVALGIYVNSRPGFGDEPTATASPSATPSVEPSSPSDGSLPVGPHVMVSTGSNGYRVAVTIPHEGWSAAPDQGSLTGGDDRVTVVTVPGDRYQVPLDICEWGTDPDAPPVAPRFAETVDELVAYLAEQTYGAPFVGSLPRNLSAPVDISIDGATGLSVTGPVPVSPPGGCNQGRFCSLLDEQGDRCLLSHREANDLVTLWILDHEDLDHLWVVAATYNWATGSQLRSEMRDIVNSMTVVNE
jgi:hypothetical protein